MSNENDETCVGCLLRVLFWFVVCSLIFVWCNRTDDKDFIDSSVEQVHHWYTHADSVWNQDDTAYGK